MLVYGVLIVLQQHGALKTRGKFSIIIKRRHRSDQPWAGSSVTRGISRGVHLKSNLLSSRSSDDGGDENGNF